MCKRKVSHLFLLVVLIGITVACHARKETRDYGGQLRIGIFHTPSEINPLTTDSTISANLLELLFNTLVRHTGGDTIVPELAERWEISPDSLTLTFYLRKDVHFHDGSSLTAEDVKFTYDTLLTSRREGERHALMDVKEVRVVDPYVIQFILSRPDRLLWDSLGMIGIVPSYLLKGKTDWSLFDQKPIGSGPYFFVKRDESEIVLQANPNYFEGRPFLDRICVQILPNQAANLSHLIAGQIDMVFLLNPEDYGALAQIPSIRIYNNWYPSLYQIVFNQKNPLFGDTTVRNALNLAIDKELILAKTLRGQGTIAAGTIDPESGDVNQSVVPYPYDPQKALRMLEERGWKLAEQNSLLKKEGKSFEFTVLTISGEDLSTRVLQLIQQQFREIGIKMNIQELPFDEYIKRVFRDRDFEANMVHYVFRPFYDNNFSFWHSRMIDEGFNFSSYHDERVDRLLEEARFTVDSEKRKQALHDFQAEIHDNPPGIFLFWRKMPIAIHRKFHGVPEKQMETLRDLVNVWVPKKEQ